HRSIERQTSYYPRNQAFETSLADQRFCTAFAPRSASQTEENRCPSFSDLAVKYSRLAAVGRVSNGTRSNTCNPYPSIPTIFLGLFVKILKLRIPRSTKI